MDGVFYMQRILLLPCICVYKVIISIIMFLLNACKYFFLGIFFVLKNFFFGIIFMFKYTIIFIINFIKYFIKGIATIFHFLYKLVYYILTAFEFLIKCLIKKTIENRKKNEPQRLEKAKQKQEQRELIKIRQIRLNEKKYIKANEEKLKKIAFQEEKKKLKKESFALKVEKKKKENDSYINENVTIEKNSAKAFINFINNIKSIPSKIKNKIYNNEFLKHRRNKRDMKRQSLLINFEGEDAEKSETKLLFQYVAKNKDGNVIKGYFEAFSKVEVHSYLLSEGYEVYSIKTNKWITLLHGSNKNNVKFKTKDLTFFLTQLSTYLKAGIPLVESLRILSRQFGKNKKYQKIFKSIIYDLTMGENFSDALLKQNVAFPRLLINMIKTAEMTGELPEVLDDMYDYYTESEKTKKQMITALMYPALVFVFATGVIIFILMFVIPQFVQIYESMDASDIPVFTKIVIGASEFLKKYILLVVLGIILVIFINIYLYKKVKLFRTMAQWLMMHFPVFGKTIIYNEVTMFTKTFGSLLAHNVFITDSMEVLNKMTNNEIYKMLILDTITNLAKGDKISKAFENNWAFPLPAYEMLVTGERTGELSDMMLKVSSYYQELHKEQVTRIKTFIEPFLTIFLTFIVGVIVLAIILPMFGMYQTVQQY